MAGMKRSFGTLTVLVAIAIHGGCATEDGGSQSPVGAATAPGTHPSRTLRGVDDPPAATAPASADASAPSAPVDASMTAPTASSAPTATSTPAPAGSDVATSNAAPPPIPDDAPDEPACVPQNRAQACVPFPGRPQPCGTHDDGCDGGIDCGGCFRKEEVCYEGTCCTPNATCSANGRAQCGEVSDGCGGTARCPDCQRQGDVCFEGACCTPDTSCRDGNGPLCGKTDDRCGGTFDCGGCGGADVCAENRCCTPAPQCTRQDGRQMCNTSQPDGCGGSSPCPACRWGGCGTDGTCGCWADASLARACPQNLVAVVCSPGHLPGNRCSNGGNGVSCCP